MAAYLSEIFAQFQSSPILFFVLRLPQLFNGLFNATFQRILCPSSIDISPYPVGAQYARVHINFMCTSSS